MQYMLLIYGNERQMQSRSQADNEATLAAYTAYGEALRKAGIIVGATG